jgi:hypothetical protein
LNKSIEEAKSKTSEIEALNVQLESSTRRINELNLVQNQLTDVNSEALTELSKSHELELKKKSDQIEGIYKRLYYYTFFNIV